MANDGACGLAKALCGFDAVVRDLRNEVEWDICLEEGRVVEDELKPAYEELKREMHRKPMPDGFVKAYMAVAQNVYIEQNPEAYMAAVSDLRSEWAKFRAKLEEELPELKDDPLRGHRTYEMKHVRIETLGDLFGLLVEIQDNLVEESYGGSTSEDSGTPWTDLRYGFIRAMDGIGEFTDYEMSKPYNYHWPHEERAGRHSYFRSHPKYESRACGVKGNRVEG